VFHANDLEIWEFLTRVEFVCGFDRLDRDNQTRQRLVRFRKSGAVRRQRV
jgi:hypothetical protein